MRKVLRWLPALTVLIGTLSTAGAATVAQPAAAPDTTSTDTDIKDRLLAKFDAKLDRRDIEREPALRP